MEWAGAGRLGCGAGRPKREVRGEKERPELGWTRMENRPGFFPNSILIFSSFLLLSFYSFLFYFPFPLLPN
jgi:hypothetical protein